MVRAIRVLVIAAWTAACPGLALPTDIVARCTIRDPNDRLLANACVVVYPLAREYRVSARATGYGPGGATSGRINIVGDAASIDPIILKPRDRSMLGVVIDVNGLPVEGAGVVLQGEGQIKAVERSRPPLRCPVRSRPKPDPTGYRR